MMPVNYVIVANFPDSRKTFSCALKGVTQEMQDYAIKIAQPCLLVMTHYSAKLCSMWVYFVAKLGLKLQFKFYSVLKSL